MVLSGYGNKAGYSTGVELAEAQRHPALFCLLLSANATLTCVTAKPLPFSFFHMYRILCPSILIFLIICCSLQIRGMTISHEK